MTSLKKLMVIALSIAFYSAIPCLAQEVHTDYDQQTDFTQFHTFCFKQVRASNQLVEGRLRNAITGELTGKGWQVASGQCDVSIAAIGYIRNAQEYTTFYDGLGPGWGWRGRWGWGGWGGGPAITTVQDIPVGTLSIDLFRTSDKALIWRGTSKQGLSNDPQKNVSKLNKAVHKVFKKFPPHK